jgi:putative two-component system response regulator
MSSSSDENVTGQPAAPAPSPAGHAAAAANPAKVMIVDDEPVNIKVVRKYLQIAGYSSFVTVTDATTAFDVARREQPDVILLDVMMPDVSGLEILAALRNDEAMRHLPVLILTASADAGTKLQALNLGATDFLAKPVEPNDLLPRIRNALVVKAHHDHLTDYSERLEQEVRRRTAELEESRLHIIECLARAAEYRDDTTGSHVIRVGRFAGVIAAELGLPDAFVQMIRLAAQLHDVGKIGIADAILLKPGKLTADEYRQMQVHTDYGQEIIAPALEDAPPADGAPVDALIAARSPILVMAANIAATHHEWWNGKGYPKGLKGTAIPIEGRITSVADVFDALATKRPYKEAMTADQCIAIIKGAAGTQFDPDVVAAFLRGVGKLISVQSELVAAPTAPPLPTVSAA